MGEQVAARALQITLMCLYTLVFTSDQRSKKLLISDG